MKKNKESKSYFSENERLGFAPKGLTKKEEMLMLETFKVEELEKRYEMGWIKSIRASYGGAEVEIEFQ